MLSKMKGNKRRLKVQDFNEVLSCFLCSGYMINPVTVDICLHSYCRSCIVKHLSRYAFCPKCGISVGKQITLQNLKSDDKLRRVIYKLVPGLYQKECERVLQFSNGNRNIQQCIENQTLPQELGGYDEDFFSPTDPISLSLEYHTEFLKNFNDNQIPPIRYLQCPASVKIYHLKRLLSLKYDIDLDNKQVDIEIIYEEDVLPNEFTLIDVGYCYNWKRREPMKFRYRIVLYSSNKKRAPSGKQIAESKKNCVTQIDKTSPTVQSKSASFADDVSDIHCTQSTPPANTATKPKLHDSFLILTNKSTSKSHKNTEIKLVENTSVESDRNAPVKVVIARKAVENKIRPAKRSNSECVFHAVPNTFKSLRSNDLRHSDYAVTSSTNSSSKSTTNSLSCRSSLESTGMLPSQNVTTMVSIPKYLHSPDDFFDSVPIAQLKTASKKSLTSSKNVEPLKKCKNLPKLKIELSGLKTKLSIPKPKSADADRHDNGDSKTTKQKKHSEESGPLADKVDIETYAKNIGLKPIEVLAPVQPLESDKKLKDSPNISPLSTDSSITSSSNGNFSTSAFSEISSSSHKKRKKKHSKDSSSKRRKLHAEIAETAEKSLKMKVKITASHNHKSLKLEGKKTPKVEAESTVANKLISSESPPATSMKSKQTAEKTDESALSKPLCKESENVINLRRYNLSEEINANSCNAPKVLEKQASTVKEMKSSPPLPPSLFKMTSLNFPSLSSMDEFNQKDVAKEQPKLLQTCKLNSSGADKSKPNQKYPQFLVPNPPRPITKFFSPPSTIGSALQVGVQLKRSLSLDESVSLTKPQKLEQDRIIRKSAYGAIMHVPQMSTTKVQHPLSSKEGKMSMSAVGNTLETPFYNKPVSAALAQDYGKRKVSLDSSPINNLKLDQSLFNTHTPSSSSAVTISARPKSVTKQAQLNMASRAQQHLFNKPALEIVRITSNQVPADKLPLPPLSLPKSNRLVRPPTTILKNDKAALPTPTTVRNSPLSLNITATQNGRNTFFTSPPALVNLKNPVALAFSSKSTTPLDSYAKNIEGNSITEDKSKTTLRDFRPTTKDGSTDILDLSPGRYPVELAQTSNGSTLEAALNKIKQNISSSVVSNSSALNNLQLLSESATTCEKIAIKAQLFEKPSTVRQQNASVRNIPNPSALAFRNQPAVVTTASSTVPVSLQNKPEMSTTTAATIMQPIFGSTTTPVQNTSGTLQMPPRTTKKPTTIDQVAANLNIRAAAAEASAAKAAVTEELVSSTSPPDNVSKTMLCGIKASESVEVSSISSSASTASATAPSDSNDSVKNSSTSATTTSTIIPETKPHIDNTSLSASLPLSK